MKKMLVADSFCSSEGIGNLDFSQEVVMTPSSLLLTIQESAALLSIGRTTMFGIINKELISTVNIGRRRFVVRADLENYVRSLSR